MGTMLDIFGSTFIAGLIFLMIFKFNIYQDTAQFSSDSEVRLQQNAKTLAELMNHDLRKIGYDFVGTPIVQADSEKISFQADIDRDGTMDMVSYFVGDSTEVAQTPNPQDRILYRVINSDTSGGPSLGLTKLKFSYLNQSGVPTTDLGAIRYVRSEMWIESPDPVDGEYIFTYWEMTINPRNL